MKRIVLALVATFIVLSSVAFSDEMEDKVGRDYDKEFCANNKLMLDSALQGRIDRIGNALIGGVKRKDIPYHFRIIESDEFDVSSMPGGYVYISDGAIEACMSDDEIAILLAHEISHCDLGHGVEIERKLDKIRKKTKFLDSITGGWAGALASMKASKSSRNFESDADKHGLELLIKAKFNPIGAVGLISYLVEEEAKCPKNKVIPFLATHPDMGKRYTFFYNETARGLIEQAEKKMPTPTEIKAVVSLSGDRIDLMNGAEATVRKELVSVKIREIGESEILDIPVYRLKIIFGEQPKGTLNISILTESKSTEGIFRSRSLDIAWVPLTKQEMPKLAETELIRLVGQSVKLMQADSAASYRGLVIRCAPSGAARKAKVIWNAQTPKRGVVYDVFDSNASAKKGAVVVRNDGLLSVVEGSISTGDILIYGYRNLPF